MIRPVEALKRPLARGFMITRFGLVFFESQAVFDLHHFFACPGLARSLQQEAATPWNKCAGRPCNERIVAVGIDRNLDVYGHHLLLGKQSASNSRVG